MKKVVTALQTGGGRSNRVKVFLDGGLAFSLDARVAAEEKLEVGQELSAEQIEALLRSEHLRRCMDVAVRYLGYRPRSEAEIRERLQQRGFEREIRDTVISRLTEKGLVDDAGFARFWKDSREAFRPRSQWLVKLELRRKGVASEIIDRVVAAIDDEDSAYHAAMAKARRLAGADQVSFRRRLGSYLRRRGFSAGAINRALERVWQDSADLPEGDVFRESEVK
ncbi:MAG: RecX family transcriptional regulator [Chloroflexi bacterium]|nr:RecX family transcriptional regulator [Chloroflexota bacterium]